MKDKRVSKSKRFCLDRISTLPQNIIETVLCLVPIQEAVRTSILSKEWRYIWTKIPKLVFDEDEMFQGLTEPSVSEQTNDVASERKKMGWSCKVFYAIYQFLLLHQGPILEFTLSMVVDNTSFEIDQIITYLTRNNTSTLKKLTLDLSYHDRRYRVPLSFFSLHQLTDLYLCDCDLHFQPTFNGFGSLTSLYLKDVGISTKTLLSLISNSPLLKSLTVLIDQCDIIGNDKSTMIKLLECLPSIEHLTIFISIIKNFVLDSVPQELPTSLIPLKYLLFEGVCFIDNYWLPFLALLIKCSPDLEKIKLEIDQEHFEGEIDSHILECFSEYFPDIWLEHLSELEIENFSNLKPELEFVMLILAKSPMLKKVSITLHDGVTKDEEVKMLRILLRSHRASPVVDIIVDYYN